MTNAVIAAALGRIEAAITSRRSNPELADLLAEIASDTESLRWNHINCLLGLLGSAALFMAGVSAITGATGLGLILMVGALAWFSACTWMIAWWSRRFTRVQTELQDLYEANLLNLTVENVDPESMAEELASHYFEFQRGDYLREVTSLHSGVASLKTGELPYKLIQFHWVNERVITRTYRDNEGNTHQQTETVYDHFYRTALLAEIDLAVDAYVYGYGGYSRGVSWKSASRNFNRIYNVNGASDIEVAKLMKPALVLLFEDLAKEFRDLNFEFSLDSTLLISMQQMDLLQANVSIDLAQPSVASDQLRSEASQPRITRLLSVVEEVNRHSVNELNRRR